VRKCYFEEIKQKHFPFKMSFSRNLSFLFILPLFILTIINVVGVEGQKTSSKLKLFEEHKYDGK
jgi:hypothetical protein